MMKAGRGKRIQIKYSWRQLHLGAVAPAGSGGVAER